MAFQVNTQDDIDGNIFHAALPAQDEDSVRTR
jgi:hypothetical protein